MGVWKALGFIVFILALKFLLPTVLQQGISTTISFLKGAEVSAQVAAGYAAQTAAIGRPALPPFALPKATQITR